MQSYDGVGWWWRAHILSARSDASVVMAVMGAAKVAHLRGRCSTRGRHISM
jgi:hypothetical protein